MQSAEDLDFFTDRSVSDDPLPWIEAMRARGPVKLERHHGAIIVTGYEEAIDVYSRPGDFSNIACVGGPMVPLPFVPEGDDVSEAIEAHRDEFMMSEHFITFDGDDHRAHRNIMMKLLSPRRLKANELFMRKFAGQLVDAFADPARCEIISDYAQPLATMVIADLLGVPEEDQAELRARILPAPGTMETDQPHDPFAYFEEAFTAYLRDRRGHPRDDMLTELADSRFADGSDPGVPALVRIASFLFIGGQDTSAKLLGTGVRILGDRPDLQKLLRDDRSKIPAFFEEVLRYESPTKSDFRLARRTTTVGGVEIKAGTVVMMSLAAANRDPRQFASPDDFNFERGLSRNHIAFGQGPHTCPGATLARIEARIGLETLFDRSRQFRIDAERHGPAGARRYSYLPSYILRGLDALHVQFEGLDAGPG
jgi:cytochrome P450